MTSLRVTIVYETEISPLDEALHEAALSLLHQTPTLAETCLIVNTVQARGAKYIKAELITDYASV